MDRVDAGIYCQIASILEKTGNLAGEEQERVTGNIKTILQTHFIPLV